MTKPQLLAELSLLPLSTLEKLYKYSQNLIIPDEDLLTNVTMVQMLEKAFDIADVSFPEWTDRSKADFGRYIVELIALFSEKDFWYINAFANESLLSKMSLFSTAFIKAVELGYSPKLYTSASCAFDVTFNPGNAYTYAIGSLVVDIPSLQLSFTNTQPFTVPQATLLTTLPLILTEGTYTREGVTFNGYRIDLRNASIVPDSVRLTINGVEWQRVKNFGQSEPTSKHFVTLPEEDGRVSIFFGEDGYGEKPAIGTSCELTYLVTKASLANNATGTLSVAKQSLARNTFSVIRTGTVSGGSIGETLASLKNNTLNYFTGKNVINNSFAVERWLNSQPEVKRSKALIQGNNVYIRVIPADGTVATTTLLSTLSTRATPFVSGGYNVSGLPTVYINTAPIVCEFYHLQGFDANIIQTAGKQLIQDYTNALVLAEYGADFDLSQLAFLLKSNIRGLQNVVFVTVAGNPAANITVNTFQILQTINLADITINTFEVL